MTIEFRSIESLHQSLKTQQGRSELIDHLSLLLEEATSEDTVEAIYSVLKTSNQVTQLQRQVVEANEALRLADKASPLVAEAWAKAA